MNPPVHLRRTPPRAAWGVACVVVCACAPMLAQAGDRARSASEAARPAEAGDRVEPATLLTGPPSAMATSQATRSSPDTPRRLDSPRSRPDGPAGGLADWRVLGALVVAFGLLAGLRFVQTRRDPALPPDVFEVLGNAPLAGPHSVRVVRFGPRTLLVAVSSGGCATLAEITDADTTARIAATCRNATSRRRPPAAAPAVARTSHEPPRATTEPTTGADASDRPGRRIASAVIGWMLCLLASTASAEPLPETLAPVPTPRSVTSLDPIDPAAGEPATSAATAGLDLLLAPRTIETLLPSALLFGVMSLVPALLLMTTCFVRMSIVLMLLRQGLGAAQVPSNQILASLALFLSALVMWPVWTEAWRSGVEPYRQGVLEPAEAFTRGTLPIRRWMSGQIEAAGNRDTMLFFLARHPTGQRQATGYDDVPLETLLPAFLVSELDTAFAIGFRMLVPFLVLDILVATLVVSTGLVMLPPTLVSLPLKLLVFVAADGWTLVVRGLLDGVGLPVG